ncbi:MAG TPA: hypothetical protein PKB14_12350 [Rubrivivax sp.]|nr:hypothetical protein [Rubrivivax sp.]
MKHPLSMRLPRRACAAALLPAAATAQAQAQGNAPGVNLAPDGVRVQLFVDQRRIAAARKQIGQDGEFPVYAYRLQPGLQALELRLDSPELMRRWKGGFVLGQPTRASFEDASQFLPVLLVLDVSNEAGAPLQVVNSYLEVQRSRSELQPFIAFTFWDEGIVQGFFDISNHGWGRAENAAIEFAFGREQPASERFGLRLSTLGAVEVTPIRALSTLVPALPRLLDQPPKCPSNRQVPACLARLLRALPMGRIADIGFTRADMVLTRLFGTLRYQWRDAAGQTQARQHPVNLEILLFRFDTGEGAEMGGAAPEEMGFSPITLPLDRERCRLPLPYRPRLGPGQNQRLQLTLNAPRASSHQFRVVLETSGGRRVAAPLLDLLYFVPNMDVG